ncbi:MAG: substrate-binding domain-containing protein [Planctomycetes bacterium]|nr:substrate-binding domain-containing protein [Planctomycetota bacterium]
MKSPGRLIAFLLSLAVFIAIAVQLFRGPEAPKDEPILVYCAAGLRIPVEAAQKAYGGKVQLQYGGSNTLLANAELSRKGDLFIAADDSYLKLAREKGLAAESLPLARQIPVLAVVKGNPKKIGALADLLKPEVKVAQANPDAAAVGKLVRGKLEKTGHWAALKEKTLVFKPTVNEVANDLKLGTVDAGFVWDATVKQYPELEQVDVPELKGVTAEASVIVLKSSLSPAAALRFARFLAAVDKGQLEFAKAGFTTVDGDAWEERPTLLLYGGAMLKPAIEKTIAAFKIREGCEVLTVYNGCGILVAQMKAGEKPDLYFACDNSFMAQVRERFAEPSEVSINQLVILVPKGNPKGIKTLKDMTKPGLKIGIGHEKQCALGVLTQETFRQTKVESEVMKNVAVQSPTGDLLVNQMRTGSLDAVVAYVSNAVSAADLLDAIPIDIPCALAVQPVAVSQATPHKQLAGRLIDALKSVESRDRFQAEGFRWKGAP